eukprot:5327487-Heterocapsa_arctica.AAC.1
MTTASTPLWCGLVTSLIKPVSDEFQSAKSQQPQTDERQKLEKQDVWDPSSVREWASVKNDPTLREATVA